VYLKAKIKALNRFELTSILFYVVTGIVLLAFLPLTSFAPHLALIGIISVITAYSLFTKRGWAPWLVTILFVVISVFSLYTLYSVGFENGLTGLSMIAYAILTWLFSIYILLKRKA
jgi:hypothetical protein